MLSRHSQILLIGAFILAPSAFAQHPLQWKLSTPTPEPRSDYAASVLDGRLIIAGGTFWTGAKGNWIQKQFSRSTHAFDPVSQTWEKLPDLPVPLGMSTSAVIGSTMFVLGGFDGAGVNRRVFALEKKNGKYLWKNFTDFPVDRVYARVVAIGNLLYAVGGTAKFEKRDPTGTCCTSKTASRTLFSLDTRHPEKGWASLAPFPGPDRFYFNAETDGRSLWMFGGIYQSDPKDKIAAFKDVCRYDIPSGKWVRMADLPSVSTEGNSPSPVFVGDGFVIINDSQKVWKLDPSGQHYTELASLPKAAQVDRYVWLDKMIVGATGENFIESPRRRSEWVFLGTFDPQK